MCAEALITPVDARISYKTHFGQVVKEPNRFRTCDYLFTSGGLGITECVHRLIYCTACSNACWRNTQCTCTCTVATHLHIKTAPNMSEKAKETIIILSHIKSRSDLALLNISRIHKSASSPKKLCTELKL